MFDLAREAEEARARIAARTPARAKSVVEQLREISAKYSKDGAGQTVPNTRARPEMGRTGGLPLVVPNRPVEAEKGPFWVDHHGQTEAGNRPRVRAGMGRDPENSVERATKNAQLRKERIAHEMDEAAHILAQNAFRQRFARRETKWRDDYTPEGYRKYWGVIAPVQEGV